MRRPDPRPKGRRAFTWRPPLASLLCALYLLAGPAGQLRAQDGELILYVRRNVGYSGGSQIQGSFRMEAEGPDNLSAVTFRIDEQVVATVSQAPFRVDFETGDYALGWHELAATGQTLDGRTLAAAPRRFEFVSAEVGWQTAGRIVLPILAVVGLAMLVAVGIPILQSATGRKTRLPLGAPRRYGLWGGTICPKCGRPFSRHWWGLNMLAGKLDRCDHCGRWSLVRRVSPDRLAEAEAAELKAAGLDSPVAELSPEERLKRQLDDSRYFDET